MRTILFSLIALLTAAGTNAQLIGTVAGNGSAVTSGNGHLATCAGVPGPSGVCVDPYGNIYFTTSHAIRKVNAGTGMITTIAGGDIPGSGGDGGLAVNALMESPRGLCIDNSGNLYITEPTKNRIRKIDAATGIITTIAGNGNYGFSGDGGPALQASFRHPVSIATDNMGHLFVADVENERIRLIDLASGIIFPFAGTGSGSSSGDGSPAIYASLEWVSGLAADMNGTVYLTTILSGNHSARVRKIQGNAGMITTIAGSGIATYAGDNGPATQASFSQLHGICLDAQGNIYLTDYGNARIRKIHASTGVVTTIAGNGIHGYEGDGGPSINARINFPKGIVADNSGNLFFADHNNHRIRKIYVNLTSPPSSAPSVVLTATSTSLCTNTPVVFTATAYNVGPNVLYLWYRNGANVGTNSQVYAPSSLNPGDVIKCVVNASTCNGVISVQSNQITISGGLDPSTSISASALQTCSGATVNFTATVNDGGPHPSYQWQINGVNAGSNSPQFSHSNLNDGDTVRCIVHADSSIGCITDPVAVSNPLVISVLPIPVPSVTISSTAQEICPGTAVTFSAQVLNGGSNTTYQWMKNDLPVGNDAPAFTTSVFNNNDEVFCIVNTSTACPSGPVSSSKLIMTVKELPSVSVTPMDTSIRSGSSFQLHASTTTPLASWQWQPAGLIVNGTGMQVSTHPLTGDTVISFSATGLNGCTAIKTVRISVFRELLMPGAFSPNGDGLNDIFIIPKGMLVQLKIFAVYDRWGNRIFHTTDLHKGWDGRYRGQLKNTGTYLYFIAGHDGKKEVEAKGTVTVIR